MSITVYCASFGLSIISNVQRPDNTQCSWSVQSACRSSCMPRRRLSDRLRQSGSHVLVYMAESCPSAPRSLLAIVSFFMYVTKNVVGSPQSLGKEGRRQKCESETYLHLSQALRTYFVEAFTTLDAILIAGMGGPVAFDVARDMVGTG